MKAIALAALALSALATPALAGPYVETKSEFKGTDSDYSGQTHQVRVGHDWNLGGSKPYIEIGAGTGAKDEAEWEEFTVLEIGTSVKLAEDLKGYVKWENKFQNDATRDWKVEAGTKYYF
jgi:hypothetical protein